MKAEVTYFIGGLIVGGGFVAVEFMLIIRAVLDKVIEKIDEWEQD